MTPAGLSGGRGRGAAPPLPYTGPPPVTRTPTGWGYVPPSLRAGAANARASTSGTGSHQPLWKGGMDRSSPSPLSLFLSLTFAHTRHTRTPRPHGKIPYRHSIFIPHLHNIPGTYPRFFSFTLAPHIPDFRPIFLSTSPELGSSTPYAHPQYYPGAQAPAQYAPGYPSPGYDPHYQYNMTASGYGSQPPHMPPQAGAESFDYREFLTDYEGPGPSSSSRGYPSNDPCYNH
ncbi:hypothetical protein FB451DRAFT_1396050 [Mycena latifolia]|nr:hypothetical protein FB451DRAFT_1396050 [Mycena latifolia]